jgi:hypothetical protein
MTVNQVAMDFRQSFACQDGEWPFLNGTVALESFLIAERQMESDQMTSTISAHVYEKKLNAADFNEAKKRLFYKRQCVEMVKELQTSFALIDRMKRARRSLALSRPSRGNGMELVAIRRDHIKLRMRPEHNHELPHFHLEYKQLYTASYQIQPFRKLAGDMPKKYEKKVSDWIENNQANLLATWAALKAGKNVHELVIARD